MVKRWLLMRGLIAAGFLLATGCAERRDTGVRAGGPEAATDAQPAYSVESIRSDPVAYIEHVREQCRSLEQYRLKFTRYERRGFFKKLEGPEHINAWFRREPFSVRLAWDNQDLKYYESAFVADEYDNMVRFITRWWVPPLKGPPAINVVDLQTPVFWGESRRPLTDFGIERLMERTLDSLRDAGPDVRVEYVGSATMPWGMPVHQLRLTYKLGLRPVPVQNLYINPETDLPAGTELKTQRDELDAAYYYEALDLDVTLTDQDFLLEPERQALETAKPDPQ